MDPSCKVASSRDSMVRRCFWSQSNSPGSISEEVECALAKLGPARLWERFVALFAFIEGVFGTAAGTGRCSVGARAPTGFGFRVFGKPAAL
ncbi:hypothetical protein KFK09_024277 [Dendrobium nobile]|uniref:Uncharacterized protein n=1 Tax=Dendrobium nobile TaxID=94219 RepID=A0A8T3AC76_DENNO|nr:hypothetical protein KFK09_024277 [Dendrobium nobile]